MKNLTLKTIATAAIIGAFALPSQAFAACGQTNGSFSVSCERGVQVYRHNAKSAVPTTAMNYIPQNQYAADNRRADVALQLEARRIRIEEKRQAAEESDLIRTRRGFNHRASSQRFVAFGGDVRTSRFNRARVNY